MALLGIALVAAYCGGSVPVTSFCLGPWLFNTSFEIQWRSPWSQSLYTLSADLTCTAASCECCQGLLFAPFGAVAWDAPGMLELWLGQPRSTALGCRKQSWGGPRQQILRFHVYLSENLALKHLACLEDHWNVFGVIFSTVLINTAWIYSIHINLFTKWSLGHTLCISPQHTFLFCTWPSWKISKSFSSALLLIINFFLK